MPGFQFGGDWSEIVPQLPQLLKRAGEGNYLTTGTCSGRIILSPRGKQGFGYDPIFVPDGYEYTFAQLGEEIKNQISHRAIALRKMIRNIIKHYQWQEID